MWGSSGNTAILPYPEKYEKYANLKSKNCVLPLAPKSVCIYFCSGGQLQGAPCGELRFYICSTDARWANV